MSNMMEHEFSSEQFVATPDERVDNIIEECAFHATYNPTGDVRIGYFSVALQERLREGPLREMLIETVLPHRDTLTASYAHNLILRAYQKQMLDDPTYPTSRNSPEDFSNDLDELLADSNRRTTMMIDLLMREANSNQPDRGKGLVLSHWLLDSGQRFPDDGVKVLEIGASIGLILKRIGLRRPYAPTTVVSPPEGPESRLWMPDAKLWVPDEQMSRVISAIINRGMPLDEGWGVDLLPVRDDSSRSPEDYAWVKSSSHYISQLADKDKVREFDEANNIHKVEGVRFTQADARDLKELQRKLTSGIRFDYVFIPTMLYQLVPEDRKRVFENAMQLVKDGGIIIVQDFVMVDPHDRNKLIFPEFWFGEPYGYRTLIFDTLRPNVGWQEFFNWKNGRCEQLSVKIGAVALDNVPG